MEDIFSISNLEHSGGTITALLTINPNSVIFQGHFPNQPVVPGACMLDVIRDVLEKALEKNVRLLKAPQLKFIGMINPVETTAVSLEIGYKIVGDEVITNGKFVDYERLCLKFQGNYTIIAWL